MLLFQSDLSRQEIGTSIKCLLSSFAKAGSKWNRVFVIAVKQESTIESEFSSAMRSDPSKAFSKAVP